MKDRQPIVEVTNLSKKYHFGQQQPYHSLRDNIGNLINPRLLVSNLIYSHKYRNTLSPDEFWSLNDISFSVFPGEVVGIIGTNGAGKSTLLKIISRVTPPTLGQITLRGHLSSLLDVGTGFHLELTGRENVYLNGAILGMQQREITRKFDQIVEFSGVAKFLDTPVKHYSSGMRVRLGFSVAAHLESEILLIDEVLAMGDTQFQKQCFQKIREIVHHQHRAVILVSHFMSTIRQLCNRCLVMKRGQIIFDGRVAQAIDTYINQIDK